MRTVLELRGEPCIELEEEREFKDSLVFSRSFSTPVTEEKVMGEVLSSYAQRACMRLSSRSTEARILTAWAMTSRYGEGAGHAPSVTLTLPAPTDDPLTMMRAAKSLLPHIREGTRYTRAGVTLTGLAPAGRQRSSISSRRIRRGQAWALCCSGCGAGPAPSPSAWAAPASAPRRSGRCAGR